MVGWHVTSAALWDRSFLTAARMRHFLLHDSPLIPNWLLHWWHLPMAGISLRVQPERFFHSIRRAIPSQLLWKSVGCRSTDPIHHSPARRIRRTILLVLWLLPSRCRTLGRFDKFHVRRFHGLFGASIQADRASRRDGFHYSKRCHASHLQYDGFWWRHGRWAVSSVS